MAKLSNTDKSSSSSSSSSKNTAKSSSSSTSSTPAPKAPAYKTAVSLTESSSKNSSPAAKSLSSTGSSSSKTSASKNTPQSLVGGGGSSSSSTSRSTKPASKIGVSLTEASSKNAQLSAAARRALQEGRSSSRPGGGASLEQLNEMVRMFAPGEQVYVPTAREIAAAREMGQRMDPFGDFLRDTIESGQQRREERTQQGVPPSEGIVDWNGLLFDMFGIRPEPVDITVPVGTPRVVREAALSPDERGRLPNVAPQVDPESGFIYDPRTGSYYRHDRLPGESGYGPDPTQIAESVGGAIQDELNRVGGILFPQGEEVATAEVPLPRRRPANAPGGIDMAVPPEAGMLPGQTEGIEITVPYGESDEARYARTHPVVPKEEPSILDRVVEGAGTILENTTLGGAVKTLFPDVWFGIGETIKGLDSGGGGGGTGSAPKGFTDTSQWPFTSPEGTGTLATPSDSPSLVGFIDLNHNGIDDRLEGYVPPPVTPPPSTGTSTNQYDRFGSVVFPDLPPYRPGIDDEWLYFRKNMAHGGLVRGYAEGGEVSPLAGQDPRIEVIAETEDVLEGIIAGEPPGEEEIVVLKSFVEQFGDAALKQLHDNVKAGMKMRGGEGRMVEGPGGPTDDAIPAMIDGNEPAALSDGEFVMTADAVANAGDGDRELGAERLMELNDRLANMGKKAA